MNQAVYDTIGKEYNQNRRADRRLVDRIGELLNLPPGATIADIGAGSGSGNYTNALADKSYKVLAVEPSAEMRGQARPHGNVTWHSGTAETLPLADASVDGVVIPLAIQHFASLEDAALEMNRICPEGPVIVFTHEPRAAEDDWFADYFPEIHDHDFDVFPPIAELAGVLEGALARPATIHSFPLLRDFADRNMRWGWGEPEFYLDAQARKNTSGFSLTDPAEVARGLKRLEADLASGEWDRRHGHLRTRAEFDAGFRLVKFGAT
jgi:ubiquinone/menaquinone biosynthesis C-methylase UbiE